MDVIDSERTFWGECGAFDSRGRILKAREARKQKILAAQNDRQNGEKSEDSVEASRYIYASPQTPASQSLGGKQGLPTGWKRKVDPAEDDVTLPWLFNQVLVDEEGGDEAVSFVGKSKSENEASGVKVSEAVQQHRSSPNRVNDPYSPYYTNLDEAASLADIGAAVERQRDIQSIIPQRDAKKYIVRGEVDVSTEARLYDYHRWGTRSIEISSPAGDALKHIKNIKSAEKEMRIAEEGNLRTEVDNLVTELGLAKVQRSVAQQRVDERANLLEKQQRYTSSQRKRRAAMALECRKEVEKGRTELFRTCQAEVLLHRDRARYLVEPCCHKCCRACCWRCCREDLNCWGCKRPGMKGCCFFCCSSCSVCKCCCNVIDVDTRIERLRKKTGTFKGCPCVCWLCCCHGRIWEEGFVPPSYLQYENDPLKLFQSRQGKWAAARAKEGEKLGLYKARNYAQLEKYDIGNGKDDIIK